MTTLIGKVFSGTNVAYAFVEKLHKKDPTNKLFATWYPGTLNIKLKEPFSLPESAKRLRTEQTGFKGDVFLAPIMINNAISGHIIRSEITHYADSVVEIVSEVCLRDTLQLKDGDEVSITFI